MNTNCTIAPATPGEYPVVGELVFALLSELLPARAFDRRAAIAAAERLLQSDAAYWALIAKQRDGKPAGMLTLNECVAIYADGAFGEIAEFYVVPEFRSAGVGAALLEAAQSVAVSRNWSLLEVGAPHLPQWRRSVDFYRRNGFTEVGPRLELALRPTLETEPPPGA